MRVCVCVCVCVQFYVWSQTILIPLNIPPSSDPHVDIKVYYKNVKKFSWKSTTKKKTLNPVYNEIFQIDLTDMDINSIYMKLVMKDKDLIFQDTFMGMVEFGKHVEHSTGSKHWMDTLATPLSLVTCWHALTQWDSMLHKL